MLSFFVFFPALFGSLFFVVPRKYLTFVALGGSIAYFLSTLSLFFLFDPHTASLQLTENYSLIPSLGIKYFLSLDGISFWYVILSAFLLPLVVLSAWKEDRPSFFFCLFLLATMVAGVFLSFDAILFYSFFEMSLFPLFFLIYLWGGEQRAYASFKFLIYTFFSSLFLLVAIISFMLLSKDSLGHLSFSLLDFYKLNLTFVAGDFFSTQSLLFFCMCFAFAVKTPLFPFHAWLPLAHVEAPTAGSVYLAAIVLKMGTYGWFRFILPLFPEASLYYAPWFLFLAVFGLIYTSVVAFAQKDMKKLIAYSSVAHMSYVLLGVFAFNYLGLVGGFYQTLTHAISSAGLFFLVGIIYERTKTRDMSLYGGLAKTMPLFSIFFFIITLSSIALPLTAGFVSEFLVLLGSYLSGEKWVFFAVLGVILSATYMLKLFQSVFLSKQTKLVSSLKDLSLREKAYLLPLVILVFIMGIFPTFFLKYSKESLKHLNKNRFHYELTFIEKEEF